MRSVQYPGRESRFGEAAIRDAATMTATLADHWPEIAGAGRCALYGHSMGAVLAFELAAELARRNSASQPQHLFVTGHQAPHLPYRAPRVHALPDSEFLPAVSAHFGGIPAELMNDPDIASLIATTLRADFTLVENYRWTARPKLTVPLSVMGGNEDPWTTRDELAAWGEHTRGGFQLRMLSGDHFFNQQHRAEVLSYVTADLGLTR